MNQSATLYVSRDDISIVLSSRRPTLTSVNGRAIFDLDGICEDDGWATFGVEDFSELLGWMCDVPEMYETIQVVVSSHSSESLGFQSVECAGGRA